MGMNEWMNFDCWTTYKYMTVTLMQLEDIEYNTIKYNEYKRHGNPCARHNNSCLYRYYRQHYCATWKQSAGQSPPGIRKDRNNPTPNLDYQGDPLRETTRKKTTKTESGTPLPHHRPENPTPNNRYDIRNEMSKIYNHWKTGNLPEWLHSYGKTVHWV